MPTTKGRLEVLDGYPRATEKARWEKIKGSAGTLSAAGSRIGTSVLGEPEAVEKSCLYDKPGSVAPPANARVSPPAE